MKAAGSQAGSSVAGERWIGTPCRVKLDIYLVEGRGKKREKWGKGKSGEKRETAAAFEREAERERTQDGGS